MRRCCDWQGWSVRKSEPLQGLTLEGPRWWNGDLCTTSRTENGCQRGCERMEIFGKLLVTPRNRTGASVVEGRDYNHLTTHQWCFRNYSCFSILVRAEDAVKLSSKVSDKNGRENQRETRWVGSGRHNENGIGCGKREWWEKVLWWGEKFPGLLLSVMDVKLAGLIVTLGRDWGAQTPWELMPFKL